MSKPTQIKCPGCRGAGEIQLKGTLGERLIQLRQAHGFTLRDAAEGMVDVDYSYLDRLERGTASMRNRARYETRLKAVAKRYGVTLEQLGVR